jgi:isopenicillin N synthase-like dioxygenase
MNMNQVPIVDISPWLGSPESSITYEQQKVAVEWNAAMKQYGCAIIVGHGVPDSQFNALNAECREFFSKPYPVKLAYCHGIYGNPLGGYTAPGKEIVALSNDDEPSADGRTDKPKFDPVENFVFTSHPSKYSSPTGQPAPFKGVFAYYEAMDSLLKTIHKLSCGALGMEELDYFNKFYDPQLPGNSTLGINGNALRLAHYPPINPVSLHGA